jgi:hypothetical protein
VTDFVFTTVAFGDHKYLDQYERLLKSIYSIYPDATVLGFKNKLPETSKPFLDSLYGFKVHAVKQAKEKGDKVIWLDPACVLVNKVDKWFEIIKDCGVIAAKDDTPLSETICDKALRYYGNPDISGWHLVGGSMYVFDFSIPLCRKIFADWEKAEADGIFGSQEEAASEQINKHRNDESCMAMSLYMNGSKPLNHDECGYGDHGEPVVIKKHFR